jgi:hypothetical protein
MREVQIRNPTSRWMTWFATAGVLLVVWLCFGNSAARSADGPNPAAAYLAVGAFVGPFFLGFLLAGIFSCRARVTLTEEGLRVRALWDHAVYPWHTIGGVRRHTTEYRSNMSKSVGRTVDIHVNGRWKELPVPKAGKFIGREDYDRDVAVIHDTWRWRSQLRPGQPTPSA